MARKRKSKRSSAIKKRKPLVAKTVNANQFRSMIAWFLKAKSLKDVVLHGNTKWLPHQLVSLALLWAWSSEDKLTKAFEKAHQQASDLFGHVPITTYQGLLKALVRYHDALFARLIAILHHRIEQASRKYFRIDGWAPFACDGSKANMPRTKSNEKAFIAKDYGKNKRAQARQKKAASKKTAANKTTSKAQPPAPLMLVTLVWHMGLRLPWLWKLGQAGSSERTDLTTMIKSGLFPKKTLFVADAGFVGYWLWRTIMDHNCSFLVRVGANVHLLQELGFRVERRKDLVLCWPLEVMRKNEPPITLRLIKTKVGKKKVTLLTNVLDKQELTNKMASRFYELRWGVELEFRSLKQVFERRKLRCRSSDRTLVEMDWSILAMTLVELFALREQLVFGGEPDELSFSAALDALRETLTNLYRPTQMSQCFHRKLQAALLDGYERNKPKAARYRPSSSCRAPTGNPKIRLLDDRHHKKLAKIALKTAA